MSALCVRRDDFRRAEVLGVSPGGVIVIASHDRSDVRLFDSAGEPLVRVLRAQGAVVSAGGGFLVLPDARGAVLLDLASRDARRIRKAGWWELPTWSSSGVEVRRAQHVEVFRPADGAVLAQLRGAFGRWQLSPDGRQLATLGGAGLIVFDWKARKRLHVVEQPFIGSVAMGADGTVAFVSPMSGELTIARAVLPPFDAHAPDAEARRAFELGRVTKAPLIAAAGLSPPERAALATALSSLEPMLTRAFLQRLRQVDDVRTAAAIRALATAASEADELADAASELADQLSFDQPFLRRRSR